MRQVSRGFLLVAVTAALAACASHAPVNSAATDAAPGAAKAAVPKGYYRRVKGGTEYYCRMEGVTGSHTFKNEVCVTPDELAAQKHG